MMCMTQDSTNLLFSLPVTSVKKVTNIFFVILFHSFLFIHSVKQ